MIEGDPGRPPTLFVTGMQRSGTTLVDKLLDHHPDLRILSQPFPLLFVETKRRFLEERGLHDPMPLTHFAGDLGYTLDDVTDFLDRHVVSAEDVATAFDLMDDYSGRLTPVTPEQRSRLQDLEPGCFHDIAGQLYVLLGGTDDTAYVGGKEVTAEEFVPHLLRHGARALVVVRDPRDVVTSLNHGRGQEWTGRPKPTLFNVRHWRKSVHVTLLETDARLIRYEDLVDDPPTTLARVADFLGVEPFGIDDLASLDDQQGRPWRPNTSFDDAKDPAGRYERLLHEDVARYIEAAALPELRLLGYPTRMDLDEAISVVESFEEPYPIDRPGMEGYSEDPANVAVEVRRLEALRSGDDYDDPALFMSVRVAEALAAVLI